MVSCMVTGMHFISKYFIFSDTFPVLVRKPRIAVSRSELLWWLSSFNGYSLRFFCLSV
jgi:hypothetical protein